MSERAVIAAARIECLVCTGVETAAEPLTVYLVVSGGSDGDGYTVRSSFLYSKSTGFGRRDAEGYDTRRLTRSVWPSCPVYVVRGVIRLNTNTCSPFVNM